jgi:hypothetical protein
MTIIIGKFFGAIEPRRRIPMNNIVLINAIALLRLRALRLGFYPP